MDYEETISGRNKAFETPLQALRADQTYLLAGDTSKVGGRLYVSRTD